MDPDVLSHLYTKTPYIIVAPRRMTRIVNHGVLYGWTDVGNIFQGLKVGDTVLNRAHKSLVGL